MCNVGTDDGWLKRAKGRVLKGAPKPCTHRRACLPKVSRAVATPGPSLWKCAACGGPCFIDVHKKKESSPTCPAFFASKYLNCANAPFCAYKLERSYLHVSTRLIASSCCTGNHGPNTQNVLGAISIAIATSSLNDKVWPTNNNNNNSFI